jgi:hypothetical protein
VDELTDKDRKFIEAMRAAVADRGEDFVYPEGTEGWSPKDFDGLLSTDCLYVRTDVDEPACLIGLALHKTGISLDDLRNWEGNGARLVMGEKGYTYELTWAAAHAQANQDMGATWGQALDKFEEQLRVGGYTSF